MEKEKIWDKVQCKEKELSVMMWETSLQMLELHGGVLNWALNTQDGFGTILGP